MTALVLRCLGYDQLLAASPPLARHLCRWLTSPWFKIREFKTLPKTPNAGWRYCLQLPPQEGEGGPEMAFTMACSARGEGVGGGFLRLG
mmetsp:Transcript_88860/g.185718  ORF Transcript_88860/g.185718 Transcript_88860/m.185718 type:complete len:89 (-) Transcript_88860:34-300(-)